jgi:hypothetical protein
MKKSTVIVDVTPEEKHKLKVWAATNKVTISSLVKEMISKLK